MVFYMTMIEPQQNKKQSYLNGSNKEKSNYHLREKAANEENAEINQQAIPSYYATTPLDTW